MNQVFPKNVKLLVFLVLTLLLACGITRASDGKCSDSASSCTKPSKPASVSTGAKEEKVVDKNISEFQSKLLDSARVVAQAIPNKPFIKDRSKAQQKIVETYIELGQPVRAVAAADKISNWRRGYCYADIACYLVENGYTLKTAEKGLKAAEQIASMDHSRKWRSDVVKSRIAQAYILANNEEKANSFKEGLSDHEKAKLSSAQDDFERQVKYLNSSIATDNFDLMKSCLFQFVGLYKSNYEDSKRRVEIENHIRAGWNRMPASIRFDILIAMADCALENSDKTKALSLVDESKELLSGFKWSPDHIIPLMSRQANYRFRASDVKGAKQDADQMLSLYENERDEITIIYRVESILPLAEAYAAFGDARKALVVYKHALKVCVDNPNPKTCSEDFTAICCSLAKSDIQQNSQLWSQIDQIKRGLLKSW